jgi:hypothetical protein
MSEFLVVFSKLLQGLCTDCHQLVVGEVLGQPLGHQGIHRPQQKIVGPVGSIKNKRYQIFYTWLVLQI